MSLLPAAFRYRRAGSLLLLLAVVAGGVYLWFFRHPPPAPVLLPAPLPTPAAPPGRSVAAPPVILPGEKILAGFADPAQPPARDLTLLHRCLDTFLLAAKGMKHEPLSANGEIAAALRGEGRVKLAFLPATHPVFNAAGQLMDRWGTPFFFHAEAAGAIGIRSAGPDRILWTEDDPSILPNGALRTGAGPH